MKTTLFGTTVLKAIFLGLVLVGGSHRALALGGDLKEPGLALPTDFRESTRQRIEEVLRLPECGFQGGRFVNWITRLRYGGGMAGLNRLLEGLAQCPEVVTVLAFGPEPGEVEVDWVVEHSGTEPGRFKVWVNTKSPRFDANALVVPAIRGWEGEGKREAAGDRFVAPARALP